MIRCQKCSAPSVVHQRYSGLHLCRSHFQEDVHRKIRESLRSYRIFGNGGKVAVAMSGGKDSSTLLYVLKQIFSPRRDIELVALLVDEGIQGYRSQTLTAARRLADRLEVPHVTRSFQEAFGTTTDQMASLDQDQAPCTFCGVLRKSLLNKTAREMGAIALCTGHNLDDEAQTVLLNYLRGDTDRLFRLRPRRQLEGLVPRVKPLQRVPEREVALYALIHDFFPSSGSCPYLPRAMRLGVKNILNDLEAKHPGTKYSIMRGFQRLLDLQPNIPFQAIPCSRCGEPGGSDTCQACKLLDTLQAKSLSGDVERSSMGLGSSAGQSE